MTEPLPADRVRIISVAYNSAAILPEMLASVPEGVEIVVVDNASTDASAEIAKEAGAKVIRLERNLGFGRACNEGAIGAEREFLFFLNPDARLQKDTLEALVLGADQQPDAVAFNPRILDGRGQVSFKRRSRLIPRSEWMNGEGPEGGGEVSILHGSALFCRRADFEAVGGFDPKIFLYHEDDDLALRLKNRGGRLWLNVQAKVTHQEGRSSVRSPDVAALKSFHMGRSCLYAMQKHEQPFARTKSLITAIGKFLSPLTWFSARKRAQARGFFAGVLDAF